jgi:hypothetical protein
VSAGVAFVEGTLFHLNDLAGNLFGSVRVDLVRRVRAVASEWKPAEGLLVTAFLLYLVG